MCLLLILAQRFNKSDQIKFRKNPSLLKTCNKQFFRQGKKLNSKTKLHKNVSIFMTWLLASLYKLPRASLAYDTQVFNA